MNDTGQATRAAGRFMADAMLGRLARWLRVLGYDTAYEKAISDERLIELALGEDRWVLTRDGFLARRRALRGRHTLITSDRVEGQLGQLRRELRLDLDLDHQRGYRCADCNVVLTPLAQPEAASLVPSFVARQYQTFLHCPACRRVFWPGTHWEDLRNRLGSLSEDTAHEGRAEP